MIQCKALRDRAFYKVQECYLYMNCGAFSKICIFLTLGRKIQQELGYYLVWDMSHLSYE